MKHGNMRQKQWTAQDVRMDNELRISKSGDMLSLVRRYHFVDGEGRNIPGLGQQRLAREIPWDKIPTNIRSAFVALHQWTRREALKEQGMD